MHKWASSRQSGMGSRRVDNGDTFCRFSPELVSDVIDFVSCSAGKCTRQAARAELTLPFSTAFPLLLLSLFYRIPFSTAVSRISRA